MRCRPQSNDVACLLGAIAGPIRLYFLTVMCRDVVQHSLQPCPDRLKTSKPQNIKGCCVQRGHRAGAIALVAVGVLVELGVPNPVLALNAPAVLHQLHQGFWGGAQAGRKEVGGLKGLPSRLTVAATSTIHLVPIQLSRMSSDRDYLNQDYLWLG